MGGNAPNRDHARSSEDLPHQARMFQSGEGENDSARETEFSKNAGAILYAQATSRKKISSPNTSYGVTGSLAKRNMAAARACVL